MDRRAFLQALASAPVALALAEPLSSEIVRVGIDLASLFKRHMVGRVPLLVRAAFPKFEMSFPEIMEGFRANSVPGGLVFGWEVVEKVPPVETVHQHVNSRLEKWMQDYGELAPAPLDPADYKQDLEVQAEQILRRYGDTDLGIGRIELTASDADGRYLVSLEPHAPLLAESDGSYFIKMYVVSMTKIGDGPEANFWRTNARRQS